MVSIIHLDHMKSQPLSFSLCYIYTKLHAVFMFLPNDILTLSKTFFMAASVGCSSKPSQGGNCMFLEDLFEGSAGPVMVMVSRKWDVNNTNGRYMSSDFLISDNKVNCFQYSSITSYLFFV